MAKVPYQAYPTEQPTTAGPSSLSISTPGTAFGENVGAAISGLGKQLEHSGNELFVRAMALQQLNNETEATAADAELMKQQGMMHAEFNTKLGKNAPDALKGHIDALEQKRMEIRNSLSNDMSKKMYDRQSLSTTGRNIFNAANHAATENKRWMVGTAKAQMDLDAKSVEDNPQDESLFQDKLVRTRENAQRIADLQGMGRDSPQEKDLYLKTSSQLWAQRITGLSRNAPFEATTMLDEHGKEMTEADRVRTERTVIDQRHNVGARVIEQKINADLFENAGTGLPEKSLADRVKEGVAEAEKLAPNDKLMPTYVADRIRSQYSKHKQDIVDTDNRNLNSVYEIMNGAVGGKLPTTLDELLVSDKARAAYEALPPVAKIRVVNGLARNAKGEFTFTEKSYAEYQILKGLATGTDEEKAKFLEQDFMSMPFPFANRGKLIEEQRRLIAKGADDPRVTRAMKILVDAGIAPAPSDKTDLTQFRGALQEALQVFQDEKKRGPDTKEVRSIGAVLRQQIPGTGWFGSNISPSRMYEIPVPSEIKDYFKKLNPNMTDEQVQREYINARFKDEWNKLYNKKK